MKKDKGIRFFFVQRRVTTLCLLIMVAQSSAFAAVVEQSQVDLDIPAFEYTRPKWGTQISGVGSALPYNGSEASLAQNGFWGLSFQMDYQPPFLQSIGVLAIGPTLNLYPTTTRKNSLVKHAFGVWSPGAQVRYQFKYFRSQPLVPIVGYSAEWVQYSLPDQGRGRFLARGWTAGLAFLLNVLDMNSAGGFYVNYGVSRSYLIAEYKRMEGGDDAFKTSGGSAFLGLRIEY